MAKALNYYDVEDVCILLGVSSSKGYKIIRELNNELKSKNYIVCYGKVPKKFFNERFYCGTDEINKQLVTK